MYGIHLIVSFVKWDDLNQSFLNKLMFFPLLLKYNINPNGGGRLLHGFVYFPYKNTMFEILKLKS